MPDLDAILVGLEDAVERKRYGGQILFFEPYPKQKLFLDMGAKKRERVLYAGTQNGKSITAAFESACHLTGKYPPWWAGRRFVKPVRAWGVGVTADSVRDVIQAKLCGQAGIESEYGTGMIARADLVARSLARGVANIFDTIQVRHVSGGISTMTFKSHGEGRENFQGESLDFAWVDEEPPEDIYSEIYSRTAATDGIIFMTYTALKGKTLLTERMMTEELPSRGVVYMDWNDAKHLSEERKKELWASWPVHERETRAYGKPMQGEGAIFRTPEDQILEPAIERIPPFWLKIWGIDLGIGHPFGAVLLLWDRDGEGAGDVIHVHATVRMSDALPATHAHAMKQIAAAAPVAWPKDGGDRDRGSGEPIVALYKAQGLNVLPNHATWPDGSISTWAGITEWDERERTGRLKIASHLQEFLAERRDYHTKRTKAGGIEIVKIRDDLLSAGRIGLMMKRFARNVPLGFGHGKLASAGNRFAIGTPGHARGDISPWTGT
jgi:phage terminase large subunit-like protein